MATAAPELSIARLWPAALLWVAVGGWAFERLPPDGSAGLWLGGLWTALLVLRWLPWARWGLAAPRIAGLCCPAPQPRASDVAMGWMMGTLWWHAEGCLGSRGPAGLWVVLHLVGMAGVAGLAQWWHTRLAPHRHQRLAGNALARTSLVLAGLIAATWPLDTPSSLTVMGLLTLAWASEPVARAPSHHPAARLLTLLAGPLGLWLIHRRWPTTGPDALFLAIATLGIGAALVWTWGRWRPATRPHFLGGSA